MLEMDLRSFCASVTFWAVLVSGAIFAPHHSPAADGPLDLNLGGKPQILLQPGLIGMGGDQVTGEASFQVVRGTQQGQATITLEIPVGYHIYSLTQQKPLKKTEVSLADSSAVQLTGKITADHEPHSHSEPFYKVPLEEYENSVTFTAELAVAPGVDVENLTLPFVVKGQLCSNSCQNFEATIDAHFAGYVEVLAQPAAPAKPPVDWGQLGLILLFGFIGGAILNLMPCVLPVIGLKVLSFARQGGQSHARIFGLNLAYSLGLIFVFLILAALAAFFHLGWGDQFQIIEFKVTMTAVVFVMALSFLGVWELPVPGFATSGKAGDLQKQHGFAGAFFKGMFTTVLATPCSGPFLGAVFPFAVKQEPSIIFLIFGCIGLGMASPYLVIGVFPGMVKFLPKPGEWMETFERVMGFMLLGTVVYLFSTFGKEYMHLFIPTFALLVALWFGCWMIGQVPEYAGLGKKGLSWLAAVAVAGVVGYGAFGFTGQHHLKWQAYDEAKLEQHLRAGRTVMIDFTADWCLTCQVNSAWAIDTKRVAELAEQNGVITMLADKTNPSPHIEEKLMQLNSVSIPLLAIYPGKNPGEPIVLRDSLIESQVVAALEKAGPSRDLPEPDVKSTAEKSARQPMTVAMP